MDLTESIPGMKPGATGRNLALGMGYAVVALFILGLFFVSLPVIAAVVVARNYRGIAERLAPLPGIGAGGGAVAGLAAFGYTIVAGIFLLGVVGGLSAPPEGAPPAPTATDTVPDGTVAPDTTDENEPTNQDPPAGTATPGADLPGDTPPSDQGGGAPPTNTRAPPTATATASDYTAPAETAPANTPAPATPTGTAPDGTATDRTAPEDSGSQSSWTVEIVRVIDGDTMEVRFDDGHTEDVRLLGVDTPEVHTENDPAEFEGIPENDAGRQHLRDWGHKASEFARSQIGGETVRIETDEEADRRGSYGRLLVYLSQDGVEFNQQLLRQGYARMYDSQFTKRGTYADLEADAQNADVGLWNYEARTATPTPVPDGGSGQGLAVAEIHADAAGDDHDNLNEEYIVFENTGDSMLDMGGWVIEDEKDHEYIVPSGFTLDPGAQVTLYTGSGDDTASELYWGSDSAVWNNGGDTIYVRDDGGSVVLERSYEG